MEEKDFYLLVESYNKGEVNPLTLLGIDPWILRNTIIWKKPNCMPSSVTDRFTVDFEPLFFFVKSKKYYFEQQYEILSESTINDKRMISENYIPPRPERGFPNGKKQNGAGLLKPRELGTSTKRIPLLC